MNLEVFLLEKFVVIGDENKALVVFQDKKIRRLWHDEEWFFSVVDVIAALTESEDARNY
ncbi:MAG: hypothetical protein WCW13_00380 [archaeon]